MDEARVQQCSLASDLYATQCTSSRVLLRTIVTNNAHFLAHSCKQLKFMDDYPKINRVVSVKRHTCVIGIRRVWLRNWFLATESSGIFQQASEGSGVQQVRFWRGVPFWASTDARRSLWRAGGRAGREELLVVS